ncbi:EamA family transporter, partial [Ideonella oryzae]
RATASAGRRRRSSRDPCPDPLTFNPRTPTESLVRLKGAGQLLAIAGLGLLLPLGHGVSTLDPVGVGWAAVAAVCWALYILFGKRVGHLHAGQSVAIGLTVAALTVVPVGVAQAGAVLLSPVVLGVGLCVAAISSAVPISLEMVALKRLPPQAFGIMISMEPAVAALLALGLLGEQLSGGQWLAIGLIMSASMGSAWSARRQPATVETGLPG